MFNVFGFDPASFSDQELSAKADELRAKVVWAGRFGSADMIGNLQNYVQMIETEQLVRWQNAMTRDALQGGPRTIESDPDLAAAGRSPSTSEPGKVVPSARPRRQQIQVTSRPTTAPKDE